MYDFAFDRRGLQREFRRSDFSDIPQLIDPIFREEVVDRAVSQAATGFTHFALVKSHSRNRDLYQISQISHDLVLRKLARNVSKLTRTRQSDRSTIIKSLRALFAEGQDLHVCKLDVRQFYPSIDRRVIADLFASDSGFPPTSLRVFQSFDAALSSRGIGGLPPGLSVSAVLAEYLMRKFDRAIKQYTPVHYYARFVDDVIVLMTSEGDPRELLRLARRHLPSGLELNHAKSRSFNLTRDAVNNPNLATEEQRIDFLGYQFIVYGQARLKPGQARRVITDIAPKKVKRIKHRICLSALDYLQNGDFSLLRDRLKLLCGNYNMYDFEKRIRRNVGVYWSYREIDASLSTAIAELDHFLKKFLLARSGKICGPLWLALTTPQRHELLSNRFSRSFSETSFHHFNSQRLAELTACWAYE